MKIISLVFLLSLTTQSFAKSTLICNSHKEVEGWDGSSTYEKVRFSAYINSNTELEKAVVKGAFKSDMRDLTAQQDEKSRKYKRARFGVLEDAWCWFNVLLPKNFDRRNRAFAGSIQYTCEDWQYHYEYVDMECFIID